MYFVDICRYMYDILFLGDIYGRTNKKNKTICNR